MVERLSLEGYDPKPGRQQQPSSFCRSLLNAYYLLASLCAITALILSAISLHKANQLTTFDNSSLFITDLERTFNSTVYAIARSSWSGPACSDLSAESVTGQTSIPGLCVNVAENSSNTMWVTRLAENCVPYAYAQQNCTGTSRGVTNSTFAKPECVVAVGSGELDGDGGDYFGSFQVLCT